MDVVKASAAILEIEKKINDGLADPTKSWLFYQAQLELDDLLAIISAATLAPSKLVSAVPRGASPGRGGPPPPPGGLKPPSGAAGSPGRGGPPPPPSGGLKPPLGAAGSPGRGGPPPPPSGGLKTPLGAASSTAGVTKAPIKVDITIITSMLGDIAKLKATLVDPAKIAESKSHAEELKNKFAIALEAPNEYTIVPPEFHGEMAAFKAKKTLTKMSTNILSIETELRSNIQHNAKKLLSTTNESDTKAVLSTVTNVFTDKALAPTKKLPPVKAKENFGVQVKELAEFLTQTKTPDSFLSNYIYNSAFRKKIDAENGGKSIFNDKKIKDTVEKLGKYKEELDKLVSAKELAAKMPDPVAVKKAEDDIEKLVESVGKFRASHPQTIKEPAPLISPDDFANKGVFNLDGIQKEFLTLKQNEQELLGYLFIVEAELPGGNSHKDYALIQKIFSDQQIQLMAKLEIADIKKNTVLTPGEKSAKIDAIKKGLLSKGVIELGKDIATTLTKTLSVDSASFIPDLAEVLTNRHDVFKEQVNLANELEKKVQAYSNKTQKIFDSSKTPPEVSLIELFKTKEGAEAIKKSLLEQTDALIAPHKKVKKAAVAAKAASATISNPLDTLNTVKALQTAQFNFKPEKGKAENAPFDDFFDLRGLTSVRNAPIKLAFAKFLTDKSAPKTRVLFDSDGDPSKLTALLKADDPLSPPLPNIVLLAIASGYLTPKPGVRLDMLKRQIDLTTFDKNSNKEKNFQTMVNDVYDQLKLPVTPSVLTNAVSELDTLVKTPNYSVELKKLSIASTKSIQSPAAFLAASMPKPPTATPPPAPSTGASAASAGPSTALPVVVPPTGTVTPPVISTPSPAAVTFSAGASSAITTPIKSLSGAGVASVVTPVDKKKLKALEAKIKDEKAQLDIKKHKISDMELLKKYAVSEFNIRGGETALIKLKNEKIALESSIAKTDTKIKKLVGIVTGTEIDASSIKIDHMIKALEGGVVVKKEDQLEVLKSAASSITNLKDEKQRLNELKFLPIDIIKSLNSETIKESDVLKYVAEKCNDWTEFNNFLNSFAIESVNEKVSGKNFDRKFSNLTNTVFDAISGDKRAKHTAKTLYESYEVKTVSLKK